MDVIIWFVDVALNGVGLVVLVIRRFIELGILRMMRTALITRKILERIMNDCFGIFGMTYLLQEYISGGFLDIGEINSFFDYRNLLRSNPYCTKCIQCCSPF